MAEHVLPQQGRISTSKPAPEGLAWVRPWSAAVFVLSVLLLFLGPQSLDGLRRADSWMTGNRRDVCAFKEKYGVGCIGCGGTHAFLHASHGRMREAFRANILGAMLGVTTWLGLFASALSGITNRGRYLVAAVALSLVVLPITIVVHTVLWWRTLPPGFHL